MNFKLFVAVWNRVQGQGTPHLHFRIADWLEESWKKGDLRLLLMVFRAAGKSTLAGLFAAWLLRVKPEIRILVLSADDALARKMVRNVKRILEQHPYTSDLKPESADQWGSDRFTVKREKELRDPSMLARGITSNFTGSRADVIIYDDVEVPNTCDTAEKRESLRARLAETQFILMPGGTMLYCGTPHTYNSIYTAAIRPDHEEQRPFLDGYKRLEIPLDEDVWPEKFTADAIESLKRGAGPNRYASQMLLQPVNIANGRLDPDLLLTYNSAPVYVKELGRLEIANRKMVSASAFWDPAFGKSGGDRSVLAVVFVDAEGAYWIQKVAILSAEGSDQTDEATRQCRQVVVIARSLYLPSVTVEINGLGRFLPNILRRELARAKVPCAVTEASQRKAKDLRILEAFDAPLAAQIIHVHEQVMQTPFANEIREWRPGKTSGHDDCIDAVASALLMQPIRLKSGHFSQRQNWSGSARQTKANSDFDV